MPTVASMQMRPCLSSTTRLRYSLASSLPRPSGSHTPPTSSCAPLMIWSTAAFWATAVRPGAAIGAKAVADATSARARIRPLNIVWCGVGVCVEVWGGAGEHGRFAARRSWRGAPRAAPRPHARADGARAGGTLWVSISRVETPWTDAHAAARPYRGQDRARAAYIVDWSAAALASPSRSAACVAGGSQKPSKLAPRAASRP